MSLDKEIKILENFDFKEGKNENNELINLFCYFNRQKTDKNHYRSNNLQ